MVILIVGAQLAVPSSACYLEVYYGYGYENVQPGARLHHLLRPGPRRPDRREHVHPGRHQQGPALAAVSLPHRQLDLGHLFQVRQSRHGDAAGGGGRHRRLYCGPGDHLQTDLGRDHRPHLRPAGGPGHRRPLLHCRGPVPRYRRPGGGPHLRAPVWRCCWLTNRD